jgi:KaiC/GvpD/RAD55 family RecA-like ATPase
MPSLDDCRRSADEILGHSGGTAEYYGSDSSKSEKTEKERPRRTESPKLVSVTLHDLLSRELPRLDPIISPWLGTQSLNMVYAWRGVGKTHFALNVAYAAASGGEFLGWTAEKPHGVLYLDGEMPGAAMQERLSSIILASDKECDPDNFRVVTPDLQTSFMPDLATGEGQDAIEEHITDSTRLIVVDNLSALVRRGGRENEAESWLNVAEWAMYQRARGRSVLFVHHAGKNGAQRGTSKREDILDCVICLRRPGDYDPATDGARFEVHFEKDRHNAAGSPFEARLETDRDGRQVWTVRNLEQSRADQVIALHDLGMSVTDIATELNMHKSNVCRAIKKATEEGKIAPRKKSHHTEPKQPRRRRDVDD